MHLALWPIRMYRDGSRPNNDERAHRLTIRPFPPTLIFETVSAPARRLRDCGAQVVIRGLDHLLERLGRV